MLRRALPLLALLLLPLSVHAEEQSLFDFRGGRIEQNWQGTGLERVEPTREGLLLRSAVPGSLATTLSPKHGVDAVTLTFLVRSDTKGALLWHAHGEGEKTFHQIPFTLVKQDGPATLAMNTAYFNGWDRYADKIGISFHEPVDVTLQTISFQGWSVPEKAREAWKTFWTFDAMRSYSINFLWGPLLTFSPLARTQLFDHEPPFAISANRIFYLLLGGAGLVLLALRVLKGRDPRRIRGATLSFLLLTGSLWMLYDLRMGLEEMGYLKHDYETYFSQPLGKRTD
ncbi:MAG: hypothetical protein PHI23_03835, partial [Candidatus Peribacteraceae bacterium]|nr:hypothetical protein [Candidatus Peribacteraceae bacterium]